MRRTRWLWILSPLVGCHDTQALCDEASLYEPTAVIGTWKNDAFHAYAEGEALAPVWGPQGGQHIWGAIRVTGMNPGDGEMVAEGGGLFGDTEMGGLSTEAKGYDPLTLTFGIHYEDDVLEPTEYSFQAFLDGTPAESTSPAQTVFVDPWALKDSYPNQLHIESEMWVRAKDACGTDVEDRRAFVIEQDEDYLTY